MNPLLLVVKKPTTKSSKSRRCQDRESQIIDNGIHRCRQVLLSFYELLGKYNEIIIHELSSGKIANTHAAVDSMAPRRFAVRETFYQHPATILLLGAMGGTALLTMCTSSWDDVNVT